MFLLAKVGKRTAAAELTLLFGIRMEIRVSEASWASTKPFIHVAVSQSVAWGQPASETPGGVVFTITDSEPE